MDRRIWQDFLQKTPLGDFFPQKDLSGKDREIFVALHQQNTLKHNRSKDAILNATLSFIMSLFSP